MYTCYAPDYDCLRLLSYASLPTCATLITFCPTFLQLAVAQFYFSNCAEGTRNITMRWSFDNHINSVVTTVASDSSSIFIKGTTRKAVNYNNEYKWV